MRFGNRERIVAGSIFALATIGALHVLVFKPRADALARSLDEYENQRRQFEQLGQSKSPQEIYKFQLENADYMIQYYDTVKKMNLAVPSYFFPEPDTKKQEQSLVDVLNQLLALRKPELKPKLTFLDNDHWSLSEKLPEDVTAGGVDIRDKVSSVIDANDVIKVLQEGSPLRIQQEAQYKQLLRGVGVDLDKANSVLPQYGSPVTALYLINCAQLVRDTLPKDFTVKTSLYDLFRLKWPEKMWFTVKQLQGLVDLIQMAREAGIEEITSVKLQVKPEFYVGMVYAPPKEGEETQVAAVGVPTAPGMPMPVGPMAGPAGPMEGPAGPYGPMAGPASPMSPEAAGAYDPVLMQQQYPGAMGGPAGAYPMMPGGAYYGYSQVVVPKEEPVGSVVLIQMDLKGPNLNVMKYLYAITHCKRSYGISYLAIKSLEEPSGWIRVIADVWVVTTAGGKLLSPEEVQKKIADWEKIKQEMLQKPGVRPAEAPAPAAASPEKAG